ncbi:MAG: rod-binding protein [Planctomycetaceae bacterium]|nr:rod-binding protein [Planctomycetaceae bacterium]
MNSAIRISDPVILPASSAAVRSPSGQPVSTEARGREQLEKLESVFLSMMIKNLRQTGGEDGLFPGDKSDTLGGLFDMFLADHMAESGGIGLAKSLQAAGLFADAPENPSGESAAGRGSVNAATQPMPVDVGSGSRNEAIRRYAANTL